MKVAKLIILSCVAMLIWLLGSCIPKKQLTQERFVVPKNFKGYCALFQGDNHNPLEDTATVREYRFDSTGICHTRFKLNTSGINKIFFRVKGDGLDTLERRLYPDSPINDHSIYTSGVKRIKAAKGDRNIIVYFFYVGVPTDPGKEEALFDMKISSIVNTRGIQDY